MDGFENRARLNAIPDLNDLEVGRQLMEKLIFGTGSNRANHRTYNAP